MACSTDRLRLAPDDHSGQAGAHKTIGTAPLYPWCANTGSGAGPTHNPQQEGADVAKSTRGRDPVDRWTRNPGVNITPLARMVPVTSIHISA